MASEFSSWMILEYHASVFAFAGDTVRVRRSLTVIAQNPKPGEPKIAIVSFWSNPSGADDLGRVAPDGQSIEVNLPFSEYEPIHHLLQTEGPAFFFWHYDVDTKKLLNIQFGTGNEPIGEGLVDHGAGLPPG